LAVGGDGGFGGGGRWRVWRRRARQLPRIQPRPAAWSYFLDRQQLSAQRGALQPARPSAAAASLRNKPLRHYLHERALFAGRDQAERQRHSVSDAQRLSAAPIRWMSTPRCLRMRSGPATFPGVSAAQIPITPCDCPAPPLALLKYFPEPNLPGDVQNYHLLTTAQSNTTQAGVRYMRSLGKNATLAGGGGRGGFGGGGRSEQNSNQGLRQSINFNYNWSHSASDNVNLFPQLGGKSSSDGFELRAGRLHGGLSQADQHLQRELESQQQPDDELLH
jgi:hypothetical protein